MIEPKGMAWFVHGGRLRRVAKDMMKPENLRDLYWRESPIEVPDTYRGWSKPVLVNTEYGDIEIADYCAYSEFGWVNRETNEFIYDVAAWMPLPSGFVENDYE